MSPPFLILCWLVKAQPLQAVVLSREPYFRAGAIFLFVNLCAETVRADTINRVEAVSSHAFKHGVGHFRLGFF
jgi:hypothetical protein